MCACQLPHTRLLKIGMSAFEQLRVGQFTHYDPLAEGVLLLVVTTHDVFITNEAVQQQTGHFFPATCVWCVQAVGGVAVSSSSLQVQSV